MMQEDFSMHQPVFIINTKSAEYVQLKYIKREYFDLMNNAFESYLEKIHNPPTKVVQESVSSTSAAEELVKYAELYEKGLLTKEEFDLKKSELMGGESTSMKQDNNIEESRSKYCPECGCEVETDSKFCSNCGNKL